MATGMKSRVVGTYEFGYELVELVLREGDSGEFCTLPSRITLGADRDWAVTVAVLLHEVFEFAVFRAGARYCPTGRVSPTSYADYLFVLDHETFHACCAKAGEFLTAAMPDLKKAHEKWHSRRK